MIGIELSVGISSVHHGSGSYGTAVSESIHALTQNFYSPTGVACYDDSYPAQSSYSLTAQEALALNELETAILGRDFPAATAVNQLRLHPDEKRFCQVRRRQETCAS